MRYSKHLVAKFEFSKNTYQKLRPWIGVCSETGMNEKSVLIGAFKRLWVAQVHYTQKNEFTPKWKLLLAKVLIWIGYKLNMRAAK